MRVRHFTISFPSSPVFRRKTIFKSHRSVSGSASVLPPTKCLSSSSHFLTDTKSPSASSNCASLNLDARSEPVAHTSTDMLRFSRETRSTPSLLWHTKLIEKIISDKTASFTDKRKRILGVLHKIEASHLLWLEEVAAHPNLSWHCFSLLRSLSQALPFFKYVRRECWRIEQCNLDNESTSGAVSPYFSESLNDALCICLRTAIQRHTTITELTALLRCAVELELADVDSLKYMSHKLTCYEEYVETNRSDGVEILWLLSLAVKRCKFPPPSLNQLLCRLVRCKLTSQEHLRVFSALIRLKDRYANEIFEILTSRAIGDVETYTVQDTIFALEAIALLNNSSTMFAKAALNRCAELAPKMSSGEIGDVAKFLALLHPGRKWNRIAEACDEELRCALKTVAKRAEQLLGLFNLRDARCVLKCLTTHKVRHSILFSRLISLVSQH